MTEHLPETDAFHVLELFQHFASGIVATATPSGKSFTATAVERVEGWLGKGTDFA